MPTVDIHIVEERKNLSHLLRSLAEQCLVGDRDRDRAFAMFVKVWDFCSDSFFFSCYWHEFSDLGHLAARVTRELNEVWYEGQALNELGWVNMEWGNFDIAEVNFIRALQHYKSLNDIYRQCKTLRYLGVLAYERKDLETAFSYYRNALEVTTNEQKKISRDDGEIWDMWKCSEAELHNLLGIYYLDKRELSTSYQELQSSIALFRSIDDPFYEYYQADPLLNVGKWYFVQQDYPHAKQYYQESLDLSRKLHRTDTISRVLLLFAEVAEAEGDDRKAIKLATEAEKTAGTEIALTREAAAQFKERLLQKH